MGKYKILSLKILESLISSKNYVCALVLSMLAKKKKFQKIKYFLEVDI